MLNEAYDMTLHKINDYLEDTCQDNLTVDEIALSWLDEVHYHNKYSTFIKYQSIYLKHIKQYIGNKRISALSKEDCRKLLEDKCRGDAALSFNTVSSIKSVLFQLLRYGKSDIPQKTEYSRLPGFKKNNLSKIEILSKEEQIKLQKYLMEDMDSYKLGILISLYTGMRLGELCALKTEDLHMTQKRLVVQSTVQRITSDNSNHKTMLYFSPPKTISSVREIPLCDFIISLISTNADFNYEYLIHKTSAMEPRTYQYKFKKYLINAGINSNLHFHSLRHTFATNCIASGMDPKCLSEILGHSDVKTTLNRYVHPTFEHKINQINLYANSFSNSF